MSRAVFLAVALVFITASAVRADYKAGIAAYRRGDFATAVSEFIPLARDGDARAQRNLGYLYEKGKGVPQNHIEAVKWYRMAAEQGDAVAQFNLAIMYYNGAGVVRNYQQAAVWFRKAADQGYIKAQFSLGTMESTGRGVLVDLAQAHMWFTLAETNGNRNARIALHNLTRRMTPAQLERARHMREEWMKKHGR